MQFIINLFYSIFGKYFDNKLNDAKHDIEYSYLQLKYGEVDEQGEGVKVVSDEVRPKKSRTSKTNQSINPK